ncbi:TolC family protein [Roseateles saccharophilus]|uniref:Outer membrane protein TolC n=1 Tax=Roseateles saccharophilus TaxID=304 RepID=A0A4R3VG71_ROSSA|nr:TolC family protein [Roseateles saccharophilus]MDG0831309.1 TolC family protein [Roseateles saccharophilus]TCV04437.1 outer membrane protein TolC [Roseateles saccharophilus]
MFSPFVRAALALGLAAFAWSTHAEPLSLQDALRLSEQRSRQLPAQDAAADAARQMAVSAGQRPDPVLKAGVDNLPINGADRFSTTRDFMTMRTVGVSQEWTRSDKLRLRSARFEREAEAAEAGRQLALANLQRDTAVAWLDLYYQQRMRALLVQQKDEAALPVQAADAAYRGGRGTQADVFAARAAVAQIDDRIAATARDVLSAKTMLTRWTGVATEEALDAPPPLDVVRLSDESLDQDIAHHPEVSVLLKQEAAAQADVDVARANKRPDVSVELSYSQRGPAYSNMVSFGVSIPLQWDQKNRQDRELGAKLAVVEQLRAQREEQTRMHVAEARTLLQQWQSDRDRMVRYDKELLPLAAERTRAALAAYRGGTALLSVVLDARRGEIDTRMERLRLEMSVARLWAQLNYLIPVGHEAAMESAK